MSQAVDEEQQHKVQEALDWFAAKMSVFGKKEQEAINACAIAFAERDQIVIPKVNIAVNVKCSQADLMVYASSAFFKIGNSLQIGSIGCQLLILLLFYTENILHVS